MEDLSEKAIIENCPHCDPQSQAFKFLLKETNNFRVVCDAHPLCEGHILIIPKLHLSSIAQYDDVTYQEFKPLYDQVASFVKETYGPVASFEHGKFGQTVFHSHVHFLPFKGNLDDILPEGEIRTSEIVNLEELKSAYQRDDGYLFVSIRDRKWTVDTALAAPRFFRDRFANAIGKPERAAWKEVHINEEIMAEVSIENENAQRKWKSYFRQ